MTSYWLSKFPHSNSPYLNTETLKCGRCVRGVCTVCMVRVEAKTTCRNIQTITRRMLEWWFCTECSVGTYSGPICIQPGSDCACDCVWALSGRVRSVECSIGRRGRYSKWNWQHKTPRSGNSWSGGRIEEEAKWTVLAHRWQLGEIADLRPAARRILVFATQLRSSLFSDFDGRYPRLLIPHGHSIF